VVITCFLPNQKTLIRYGELALSLSHSYKDKVKVWVAKACHLLVVQHLLNLNKSSFQISILKLFCMVKNPICMQDLRWCKIREEWWAALVDKWVIQININNNLIRWWEVLIYLLSHSLNSMEIRINNNKYQIWEECQVCSNQVSEWTHSWVAVSNRCLLDHKIQVSEELKADLVSILCLDDYEKIIH